MADGNPEIDKQIAITEGEITKEDADKVVYTPIYKEYPETKIPVAKSTGAFWQARWSEGKAFLNKDALDRWDEAISYYQNDQSGKTSKRKKLNEAARGKADEQFYTTENIVFSNISALVPATYAKNPDIEITATKETMEAKARMYEKLIDVLFARKGAPGMNIKPKVRRAVITTFLTNICYLQLDYVRREDASEAALEEIVRLSKELQEAKTTSDIEDIEGRLLGLEQKVNLLSESGPYIKVVQPNMVIRDPNVQEGDLSGDTYLIVGEFIRTNYLRAVYATKGDNGEYHSIYEPTHVLPNNNRNISGHDDEINHFSLLSGEADFNKYGYKSQEDFDSACRTLVWKVWDKTTRRVLMFNDKDWSWPIWVWDDPYKLTRFFNIFPLQFYTDPIDVYGRSEVMYYLDQQDEINISNMERARMRHWVMTKIFYDKNVFPDKNKLQEYLSSSAAENIFPVDLPQGSKLQDALSTLAAPSTQFEQLFDNARLFEAVNRLSSVTPTLQASQFKTNTTNKAIESYEASTQTRLDEKIDAIEDILGDVASATLEMCIQFMDAAMVTRLIGDKLVQEGQWINEDDPKTFQLDYGMSIIGGSTLKPTSKVKKEQAMNLGQVLGQFAQASPAVVLIMLKMLERAFNEDVVITNEEWSMMIDSVMQQITGQQGGGGGQQQGGDPTQQLAQAVMVIDQFMQQIPPEAVQQVGQLISKGVPISQVIQALMQQAQQQQQLAEQAGEQQGQPPQAAQAAVANGQPQQPQQQPTPQSQQAPQRRMQ